MRLWLRRPAPAPRRSLSAPRRARPKGQCCAAAPARRAGLAARLHRRLRLSARSSRYRKRSQSPRPRGAARARLMERRPRLRRPPSPLACPRA
eukprot:3282145-Alexandrium_andersonii.AAC.1